MEKALINLSKLELLMLVKSKEERIGQSQETIQKQEEAIKEYQTSIAHYKAKIAQLQRMLFGQKRERFEAQGNQLALPFESEPEQLLKQEEVLREKIEYVRGKQSAHKGRVALPEHLPVEEIEIYPEGDLLEMVCIGKEITEELECVPAKFFIRRYIRYKYARKEKEGVVIGTLPERVIDKGIPGFGLLATILVDKYMDHLPLYRQRQRFLREKIPISSSTLEGWVKQGLERIEVLYAHLLEDTKSKGYLQADETTIPVLENHTKGRTHQGYYWVYYNPIDKVTLFDYQPGRTGQGPRGILLGFKGYLQTDGYQVYTQIVKPKEATEEKKITHLGCWAHARRHFEGALENDNQRASIALVMIQELYQVEREARNEGLTPMQRKELRLAKSLPVLNRLGQWISQEVKHTLPKSQIGKAMSYAIARWEELSVYLSDGMLEIDNNLVENAIRPVALGGKNYLFAGSHAAAQRAAMIYSFFAICKQHQVNPFEWLKYTLEHIMTIKYENVRDLYPQNFKLISNM